MSSLQRGIAAAALLGASFAWRAATSGREVTLATHLPDERIVVHNVADWGVCACIHYTWSDEDMCFSQTRWTLPRPRIRIALEPLLSGP